MTSFGDATPDDSWDPTAPADPEAVARLFVAALFDLAPTGRVRELERLDPELAALYVFAFAVLLARLRREGSLGG